MQSIGRKISGSSDSAGNLHSQSKRMLQVYRMKKREQQWNGRFHLDQIPDYDYYQDPYSYERKPPSNKGLRPMSCRAESVSGRTNKKSSQQDCSVKDEYSSGQSSHPIKLQRPDSYTNRPPLHSIQTQEKDIMKKTLTDLKKLWKEKMIPQEHIQCMIKIFSRQHDIEKAVEQIKRQYLEIYQNNSLVQKLMATIESRRVCLESLRLLLIRRIPQDPKAIIKLIKQISQKFEHYRILTIHCVECLFQWRQNLDNLNKRPTNISLKIGDLELIEHFKRDYEMIRLSCAANYFIFSFNMDIFLVDVRLQTSNQPLVIGSNLQKRIKLCESILKGIDDTVIAPRLRPKSQKQKLFLKKEGPTTPKWNNNPVEKHTVDHKQFHSYVQTLFCSGFYHERTSGQPDFARYEQLTVLSIRRTCYFVIGVDRMGAGRKIHILKIKCQPAFFKDNLKQLSQYLWDSDNCSEIRIFLKHFGLNLSVCPQTQEILHSLSFKWVSVSNNEQERVTLYCLKRPNDKPIKTYLQQYPLICEQISYLPNEDRNLGSQPNYSQLNVLYLLKLICDQGDQETQDIIVNDAVFEPWLQKLDAIVSFNYSGIIAKYIKSQQKLRELCQRTDLTALISPPTYLSFINTSYRFRNFSFYDGKHLKIVPEKDNQITVYESQKPIYILELDQESISIFVFEVDESFTQKQILQVFNARGNQVSLKGQLWLPRFTVDEKYDDELGIKNGIFLSNNYCTSLQSLTSKNSANTRIIKTPFVFGLINRQLLQKLQIPFLATVVRQAHLK